jgi:RHS repeat-associated protein
MYYRARFYDPSIGRFISPDSFTRGPDDPRVSYSNNWYAKIHGEATLYAEWLNPHNFNRYIYCNNNPVGYVDPLGLEEALLMMGNVDSNSKIPGLKQLGTAVSKLFAHIAIRTAQLRYSIEGYNTTVLNNTSSSGAYYKGDHVFNQMAGKEAIFMMGHSGGSHKSQFQTTEGGFSPGNIVQYNYMSSKMHDAGLGAGGQINPNVVENNSCYSNWPYLRRDWE